MGKKQKMKIAVTLWIVVVLVLGIQVSRLILVRSSAFSAEEGLKAKGKGAPSAKLKIIEYSDFQCPACSAGAKIVSDLFKAHPEDISMTFHHLPLSSIHRHALKASVFAECAGQQDKFWEMHDRLFETQEKWQSLENVHGTFLDLAKEVGLDMTVFQYCVVNPEVESVVLKQKDSAMEQGIRSTPTFFLNGEMIVGTKVLRETILKILNEGSDNSLIPEVP